jgi:hypothetical protein
VLAITNSHVDHVYGFSRPELWNDVSVGEVWMPWTRDPHAPGIQQARATNAKAFATLAELASSRSRYLPRPGRYPDTIRGASLESSLPTDVTIHVLGPSRDPAVIRAMSPPVGAAFGTRGQGAGSSSTTADAGEEADGEPDEPEQSGSEVAEIAAEPIAASSAPTRLKLDDVVNGTSLVLLIEVGGRKLLFASDAQWGTWQMMLTDPTANALLRDLAFYKVGHHGSRNGTPRAFVEGRYLDGAVAMVSVSPIDRWTDIPNAVLLDALASAGAHVIRSDGPVPAGARGVIRSPADTYTEVTFPIRTEGLAR